MTTVTVFLLVVTVTLSTVVGKLPTIVEDRPDKSKDMFRVNPSPPRGIDDILIPYGFQWDDLQYIFDYKNDD